MRNNVWWCGWEADLSGFMNLYSDYDDLEQLKGQFEGFAAFGVVFITGAHEEVLQLPPQGLLLFLGLQPWPRRAHVQGGRAAMTPAVQVAGAVSHHRGQQTVRLWRDTQVNEEGELGTVHFNLII